MLFMKEDYVENLNEMIFKRILVTTVFTVCRITTISKQSHFDKMAFNFL